MHPPNNMKMFLREQWKTASASSVQTPPAYVKPRPNLVIKCAPLISLFFGSPQVFQAFSLAERLRLRFHFQVRENVFKEVDFCGLAGEERAGRQRLFGFFWTDGLFPISTVRFFQGSVRLRPRRETKITLQMTVFLIFFFNKYLLRNWMALHKTFGWQNTAYSAL